MSDEDLRRLLKGEKPDWTDIDYASLTQFPTLVDKPADADLLPLTRLGCKTATGAGKTVVIGMLVAWALCNRGRDLGTRNVPGAILVACPNLTVKGRLQVLRTEIEGCFREPRAGSRNGRIVLVRYGTPGVDPAGAFTVKEYRSEKVFAEEGGFRQLRIELKPRSRNPIHQPIVLTAEDEGEVRVMAEFVEVVG